MKTEKIGLIFPAGGRKRPEEEIGRYLPAGLGLLSNQVRFDRISPKGLMDMGERVEKAAVELSEQGVKLIVFCCTSGSFIRGIGYDQELIDRIEKATGVPSMTTTTAVIAALKKLGIERLAMGTPYPNEVNEVEVRFLADSGIQVVKAKGLGIHHPPLVSHTTTDALRALVAEVDCAEAQAIFVSCTGLLVVDLIPELENTYNKPVITSNQATLWLAMKKLDRKDPVPLGTLFTV